MLHEVPLGILDRWGGISLSLNLLGKWPPKCAKETVGRVGGDAICQAGSQTEKSHPTSPKSPMEPRATQFGGFRTCDPGKTAIDFGECVCREVLISEEHPVVTRFWLFAKAVRKLLTLMLFTEPAEVLRTDGLQMMPNQSKRAHQGQGFFGRWW